MAGAPTERLRRRGPLRAPGAAALVTIDRQHRRNAVDGPTAAALHEAYLRFEADDDARVLVLTGAGGVVLLRRRRPEGDRARWRRG